MTVHAIHTPFKVLFRSTLNAEVCFQNTLFGNVLLQIIFNIQ